LEYFGDGVGLLLMLKWGEAVMMVGKVRAGSRRDTASKSQYESKSHTLFLNNF
tara:strand:- start:19 stop:177 length:159 start_codon:yes stop_codon:yes gene_type:complete